MPDIPANLNRIRETIAVTASAANRAPASIKLIAVSKSHSVASIESAAQTGQAVFGESTVQESAGKISHFAGRAFEWHFIGHLQSNKAKFLPGNFSWLHSLADLKLAQRLSRLAEEKKCVINTLIEVNVTNDPKKHGVAPTEIFTLLDTLLSNKLRGLAWRGLMTIGPHSAPEREIRAAFAALRTLRDDCSQRFSLPEFTELSMGMSGDYIEAIKEGSTMLRVGTAIFGARNYGAD
jgi:PLP dependent protein